MHQKSIKMRSGTVRAASWKQVGSGSAPEMTVLAFQRKSVILGAILGARWILKGVQKSPFWSSCWKKTRKRKSGSGSGKNMKFGWIWDAKMGGFGRRNSCFCIGLLQKNKVSAIPKFHEKWMPKRHQKSMKIGASGAQGPDFYDFGRFLEGVDFR